MDTSEIRSQVSELNIGANELVRPISAPPTLSGLRSWSHTGTIPPLYDWVHWWAFAGVRLEERTASAKLACMSQLGAVRYVFVPSRALASQPRTTLSLTSKSHRYDPHLIGGAAPERLPLSTLAIRYHPVVPPSGTRLRYTLAPHALFVADEYSAHASSQYICRTTKALRSLWQIVRYGPPLFVSAIRK